MKSKLEMQPVPTIHTEDVSKAPSTSPTSL